MKKKTHSPSLHIKIGCEKIKQKIEPKNIYSHPFISLKTLEQMNLTTVKISNESVLNLLTGCFFW
jgi:hypothetical protein